MAIKKSKTKSLSSKKAKSMSMSSKNTKSKSKSKSMSSTSNIGILDPEGINKNPLTGEPYQNIYETEKKDIMGQMLPATYANLSKIWTSKLVYDNRHKLIDGIKDNQVVLASAGTGVGKTILIPKFALHALNYNKRVIVCIPRRLLVRSSAEFAAQTLDVKLGEEVGYYYKGERKMDENNKKSLLIFTTIGSIISRITGTDPTLEDYGCVILDEAHETTVANTITLYLMKKALKLRPDLKFVIMSATINLQIFRDYFKAFKFAEFDAGTETTYPIKQIYNSSLPLDWYAIAVEVAKKILLTTKEGDIVIFGRSDPDGTRICDALEREITRHNKLQESSKNSTILFCTKLSAGTNKGDAKLATSGQAYLLEVNEKGQSYTRKVVVSTNVAESSITIDNARYIIDSGLQYEDSFDPISMVRYLVETDIPQSSIKQRIGRTGRTGPGTAFHLYTRDDEKSRPAYPTPEIQKSDITTNLLDLIKMKGVEDTDNLKNILKDFITPPSDKLANSCLRTLTTLGAITNKKMTRLGEVITKFRDISPQFAKAIIYSYKYGCSREICDIVGITKSADGRIDKILKKFEPDRKKSPEENKRLQRNFDNIRKQYIHPLGDYFSCYLAFKDFMKQKKPIDIKDDIKDDIDTDIVKTDIGDTEVIIADIDEEAVAPVEKYDATQKNIKRWCKERNLNYNVLKQVELAAKQLHQTIRRFKHLLDDIQVPSLPTGISFDEKLMCVLVYSAPTNIARLTSGDIYVPCFPLDAKKCRPDRDSTISGNPEFVFYDELFVSQKNQKYVKMNMVNKIPKVIASGIENNKMLDSCFDMEKFAIHKVKNTFKKQKPRNSKYNKSKYNKSKNKSKNNKNKNKNKNKISLKKGKDKKFRRF